MDKNLRTLNQINIDLRGKNSRVNEQCMLYKKGRCGYGQKCRFSHVDGYQSNLAKYSADEYLSDNDNLIFKTTPCKRFWNGEFCAYGKKCYFLHDEPLGKTCYRKTQLCHKWEEKGSCPYGRNCRFIHGKDEPRRFRSQIGEQHEIISNSKKRSATAAPHEPYCGTANESACDQDKKRCLFKSKKKFNGIYADWIDEIPLENCSLDEVAI